MRQMFYLVEETVPFALCDDCVSSETKKSIVFKLLSSDRPQNFVPMKPLFKQDILLESIMTNLNLVILLEVGLG